MIMAVEHQLSAVLRQHQAKITRIIQPFTKPINAEGRAVMHQHDPKKAFRFRKAAPQGDELLLMHMTTGEERRLRHSTGNTKENHRPTAPDVRKTATSCDVHPPGIIAHPGAQLLQTRCRRWRRIGIMISGDDRDVIRRTKPFKPQAHLFKFFRQGDLRQISGHDHMLTLLERRLGHRREHLLLMNMAPA